MALTDDIKDTQDMLNELWENVQEQKELTSKDSDRQTLVYISTCIDEAQDSLDSAIHALTHSA